MCFWKYLSVIWKLHTIISISIRLIKKVYLCVYEYICQLFKSCAPAVSECPPWLPQSVMCNVVRIIYEFWEYCKRGNHILTIVALYIRLYRVQYSVLQYKVTYIGGTHSIVEREAEERTTPVRDSYSWAGHTLLRQYAIVISFVVSSTFSSASKFLDKYCCCHHPNLIIITSEVNIWAVGWLMLLLVMIELVMKVFLQSMIF